MSRNMIEVNKYIFNQLADFVEASKIYDRSFMRGLNQEFALKVSLKIHQLENVFPDYRTSLAISLRLTLLRT